MVMQLFLCWFLWRVFDLRFFFQYIRCSLFIVATGALAGDAQFSGRFGASIISH